MHDKIEFLFVLRSFLETSGIRSMIKNRRRVNKNNWWAFDKHERSADQMCKLGKWFWLQINRSCNIKCFSDKQCPWYTVVIWHRQNCREYVVVNWHRQTMHWIYSSYLTQTNNALTQTMLVRNRRPLKNERCLFFSRWLITVSQCSPSPRGCS